MAALKFNLPAGYDEQRLFSELAGHYLIQKEISQVKRLAFYDTFDWRLYDQGLYLYQSEGEVGLSPLAANGPAQRVKMAAPPVFIKDFPAGRLKKRLEDIVEMRALLKLVEAQIQTTPYRLLNQDEKTVLWLVYEEIKPAGQDTAAATPYLRLRPVRGYTRYPQELAAYLQTLGGTPLEQEPYLLALALASKTPGDYSSKVTVRLNPTMRADEAVKMLLRFLLTVMQRNEPYLKSDVDTEFLHDFRVAVRRGRSALGQLKGVFPAEVTERLKDELALIGRLTNELRDLDVYLLAEDDYRAMLPDVLRNDIAPLFDYLAQKRANALQTTIAGLNSAEYDRIMHDLATFLQTPSADSPAAPDAGQPIRQLAQQRIYKHYARIIKSGRYLLDQAEDDRLHALRIECKKLRYLLEFFVSLFPPDDIALLIKSLKKLQDNLGRINDLRVQEQYLLSVSSELSTANPPLPKTLLALGSLVGSLDQEGKRARTVFAQTFREFALPAHQALFEKLFNPSKREDISDDYSSILQ